MVAALQSAISNSFPFLWVHVRGEAEVQTDRLHDPEHGAFGIDIRRGEHAPVLLDDRSRTGLGPGVEKSSYRSPRIVAVLLKEGCGVDAYQRLPDTGVDVGHVLLVQGHAVAL